MSRVNFTPDCWAIFTWETKATLPKLASYRALLHRMLLDEFYIQNKHRIHWHMRPPSSLFVLSLPPVQCLLSPPWDQVHLKWKIKIMVKAHREAEWYAVIRELTKWNKSARSVLETWFWPQQWRCREDSYTEPFISSYCLLKREELMLLRSHSLYFHLIYLVLLLVRLLRW